MVEGAAVTVGPEISVEDLLRRIGLVLMPEAKVELGAGISSMRRK